MPRLPRPTLRKGFTLIELLIVILIVSTVYFLGFSGVEINKQKPKALTPLNLKVNIVKSEWFNGHATLLCINKCKTCYLRKDISSSFQTYSDGIDLSDIEAYTLDESDHLVRIEYERFNDKKICLKIEFYDNGSSTQIILKNDQGTYFLPAYFGEPTAFESPDDAQEYWLANSRLVSDSGDYY